MICVVSYEQVVFMVKKKSQFIKTTLIVLHVEKSFSHFHMNILA